MIISFEPNIYLKKLNQLIGEDLRFKPIILSTSIILVFFIIPVVFSDVVEIVIEYEETGPVYSYEVIGVPVNFGSLHHNTTNNPATSPATITNTGTGSIDISIKAEDFVSGSFFIGIENCTYNTINNPLTSTPMPKNYVTVATVAPAESLTLWFWVDVPEYQKALNYNSIIYINAVGV